MNQKAASITVRMGFPVHHCHADEILGSIVDVVVLGMDGSQFPTGIRA